MPLLTIVLLIIVGIILVKVATSIVMELLNAMLNILVGCLGWIVLVGLFCGVITLLIA